MTEKNSRLLWLLRHVTRILRSSIRKFMKIQRQIWSAPHGHAASKATPRGFGLFVDSLIKLSAGFFAANRIGF
jgi:hypothetical protein